MRDILDEFSKGTLDCIAWVNDWNNGEWEFNQAFSPSEIYALETVGVTAEMIEWMVEQKIFVETEGVGSDGEWAQIMVFELNDRNVRKFQNRNG